MGSRAERTIEQAVELQGVALFSAADVVLRFLPAPPGHGRAFRRTDLPGSEAIPATIAYAVDRHRRTAVANGDAVVEMTEHVLAALAGLEIDNCLVEIDGPECPGFDGSARSIVEALEQAGIVKQPQSRTTFAVVEPVVVTSPDGTADVLAEPSDVFEIVYELDYGPGPIPRQSLSVEVTPESFATSLAAARTFVLEQEIAFLRSQGYGARTTAADLLVFGEDGRPVDNELRWRDECVRHKLLDCVGDFALLGADVQGRFVARRSGHQLNRDLVRAMVGRVGNSHCRGVLREAA